MKPALALRDGFCPELRDGFVQIREFEIYSSGCIKEISLFFVLLYFYGMDNSFRNLDLRHLRYFVAVAEAGSISRGARVLNISQPPLSKKIRALEEDLGVQLLIRDVRGICLTKAGSALLAEARAILERSSESLHMVRQIGRGEVGHLRIGVLGWLLWGDLPGMIGAYSHAHPSVRWNLFDTTPLEQIDMLRSGRLDVGLSRTFGEVQEYDDLLSSVLRTDELCAVLPASHPFASEPTIHLHKLEPLDQIAMADGISDFSKAVTSALHVHGISPQIGYRVNEIHTALALVANGLGYAFFSKSLSRIPWPGLKFVSVVEPLPRLHLRVFSAKSAISPTATRFIEFLHQQISSSV